MFPIEQNCEFCGPMHPPEKSSTVAYPGQCSSHRGAFTPDNSLKATKTLFPFRWFEVPGMMRLLRAFASVTGVIWPFGSAPAHFSHTLPLLTKGGR